MNRRAHLRKIMGRTKSADLGLRRAHQSGVAFDVGGKGQILRKFCHRWPREKMVSRPPSVDPFIYASAAEGNRGVGGGRGSNTLPRPQDVLSPKSRLEISEVRPHERILTLTVCAV